MAITKVTSGLISADASSIDLNIDAGTLYLDVSENKVGIGNTSPTEKLHVQGTALMSSSKLSTNNGTTYWDIRRDSSTGHFVISDDGLGDVVTIKQDTGNVGIGTTSPSVPLDINIGTNNNGLYIRSTDRYSNIGLTDNTGSIKVGSDNGAMFFEVGGDSSFASLSEAMRIDSSGNFGIGTSSPSDKFHVKGTGSTGIVTERSGTSSAALIADSTGTALYSQESYGSTTAVPFRIYTGTTEALRIDSAQVVMRGTTTRAIGVLGNVNAFGVAGNSAVNAPMVVFAEQDPTVETSSCILELSYSGDTSFNSSFYALFSDSGGTQGTISGTGSGTVAFNVSSDERIKENIVDTGSQLETIKQIQVRDFNYIGNNTTTTGMIAQELNTILPNVVQQGAEDATKHPWGIDYGKLTPYLIKAIQEQQTIIDDLKTRIETLENA